MRVAYGVPGKTRRQANAGLNQGVSVMKGVDLTKRLLVGFAVLGCCLPSTVWAADAPAQSASKDVDVALRGEGLLLGQVVDVEGRPVMRTVVSLRSQQREVARTATNDEGYFAVRGLSGGVYQVVAADGIGTFRLWNSQSAPPSCQQGALVVAGSDVFRGQVPGAGAIGFYLGDPLVIGGIVATAVAVPVGVHQSRRPASP